MKKLISLLAVCLLILTISVPGAFAWGKPKVATATATINPSTSGASGDDADVTSKPFPSSWSPLNLNHGGDDGAWAIGGSGGSSENKGTAAAGTIIPFRNTTAYALGDATAVGATKAGAFAYDIGLSVPFLTFIPLGPQASIAGSAIGTVVNVQAHGTSGFNGKGILGAGIATNESKGTVEGQLDRGSYVNEISSGPTFAQGSETSSASFYGEAYDKACDADAALFGRYDGNASSGINMTGGALTAGGSVAYVEPNGKTQSAFAAVGNKSIAGVYGADYQTSNVSGSGNATIQAAANNNNAVAIAGATGSFGYSGSNVGMGATIMHSTASVGDNSFSAAASGASFATTK